MLGKKRKIISKIIHQLSFSTKPLTVLLTPPISSPIGSEGIEKRTGATDLLGISIESKLRIGEAAGGGAGIDEAGGKVL